MTLVEKKGDRLQSLLEGDSHGKGRLDHHEGLLALKGTSQLVIGQTSKGVQPRIAQIVYVNGRHGLPPLPHSKPQLVYDNSLQGHLNP